GEGGMLVTDREDVYRRVLFLRDHGRPPGDKRFDNTEVGYKYKMSSLQAALGLAQLERIDQLVAPKRQIFRSYRERLPRVTLNREGPGVRSTYWMVTGVIDHLPSLDKYRLMALLGEQGIDSRPFFNPLSSLRAFAGSEQARRARDRNHISYAVSPHGIN